MAASSRKCSRATGRRSWSISRDTSRSVNRRPTAALSQQQCRQEPRPDRSSVTAQGRSVRVLQHLRRLRPAANRAAGRIAQDRADQPLCRLQGERRTRPRSGGLAGPANRVVALLQRHGCGRGGGNRRGPRAGNPSSAARRRGGQARRLSCTVRTIRPRTVPACATTSITDLGRPIWARCNGSWAGPRGRHEVFNLGSGTGHSVRQVVDSIGRIVGRPVPHVYGARRPGDSPRLVGCIDKARRELGWTPVRSLETQIEDTVRWRMSMQR